MSAASPQWRRDGRDWPNRDASRFVRAAGLPMHVQVLGDGPSVLLLHGAGRFTVVAPDLPGHGFSGLPAASRMSLPGVSRAVAAMLRELDIAPDLVVGHSAGAAIAARMVLDGRIAPRAMMSLNGALLPPRRAQRLYPAAAKLLANTPIMPWLFSMQAANADTVGRLLANTGSRIDADGMRFYGRLFGFRSHVAGALRLMAQWDLGALDLAALALPVTLVAGATDRMIPPDVARQLQALLPQARVIMLPGLGHLAHEEEPRRIAELIGEMADAAGLAPRQAVPA